jgi:hypothetical protein
VTRPFHARTLCRRGATINDIALRHGFSPDAVLSMLESVINGSGNMALFQSIRFSGSGQTIAAECIMVIGRCSPRAQSRVMGCALNCPT